jgi:hypothetical protein
MVNEQNHNESKIGKGIAIGIAIGAALGVTFGIIFDNLAIGISIGIAMEFRLGFDWFLLGKTGKKQKKIMPITPSIKNLLKTSKTHQ